MQPLLKGRPARITVLDYGLFQVHANGRIIGICGYLVQTDADENVLIDTGFPAKYADDPQAATREDDLGSFGRVLSITPENLAPAQLQLLGLEAQDITLMIQSHTHIDHVGFIAAFPQAPIVIAAAERALPRPLYWSGKQPMDWPARDYIEVTQDSLLGQGFRILLVPGHAPGQLAFLLDLPQTGAVLLTSDAISRAAEINEGFAGAWDPEQAAHHADRLMRIAGQHEAMVIFGHAPEQWPTLRKAPDGYG